MKRASKHLDLQLVQVHTINDLRTSRGKRRSKQPYWVQSIDLEAKEETLSFHFVHDQMDVKELIQQIQKGRVWTLPQYIEPKRYLI